jgi:hypothetical protein
LTAGRDFTDRDTREAPLVAIVNETLARRFWPGESALGRRLRREADGPVMEVIGVARDSQYVSIGEDARPFLYQPLAQAYSPQPVLLVRTTGAPVAILPSLKRVVESLDPRPSGVQRAAPMDEATSISLLPAKIAGRLAGARRARPGAVGARHIRRCRSWFDRGRVSWPSGYIGPAAARTSLCSSSVRR